MFLPQRNNLPTQYSVEEPITPANLRELLEEFADRYIRKEIKDTTPVWYEVVLNTQPYVVDYKQRKHVFVFNTTAANINITTPDGYNITLPTQAWFNLGVREGTRFTGSATGILLIKCSDEVAP